MANAIVCRVNSKTFYFRLVKHTTPLLALAVTLGTLFLTASCISVQDRPYLQHWGITYQVKTFSSPRPNQVHIMKIDLAAGKVEPAVVIAPDPDGDGPAEAALTNPFTLAGGPRVLAFINTNPWGGLPDATGKTSSKWYEGQPVDIAGLAMSNRIVRSPVDDGYVCVRITANNQVVIGNLPIDDASEGMAGFMRILENGKMVARPDEALAPRTAIGTDRSGRYLWLVVVDGRQPGYSEGMSEAELGTLMKEWGCWDAVNMDGGGSSVMGLVGPDGALRLANSPSSRFLGLTIVRPLPMILTLREKRPPK